MNDETMTEPIREAPTSEAQATALKLWVVLARAMSSLQAHLQESVTRHELTLTEFAECYLNRYFAQHAPALPPPGLYQRMLRELELPLIGAALAATQGNQIRAAELLGINRNTLRTRIRDLGIRVVRGAG